ncbi:MAG: hypothetical protein GC162_09110 [Planctomycetes bacterium]|nr:hypothetical protein [Planctomycetota bacterium]
MSTHRRDKLIWAVSFVTVIGAYLFFKDAEYNGRATLYYVCNALGLREAALYEAKKVRACVPRPKGKCLTCNLEIQREEISVWAQRIQRLEAEADESSR